MDLLPSDVVVHIFRYFNFKDVLIFKQLSSRLKEITETNKNSLSIPTIEVSVCVYTPPTYKSPSGDDYTMFIAKQRKGFFYALPFSEEGEIPGWRTIDLKKFIGDHESLTVEELFPIVFSKGVIDFKMGPFKQKTLEAFGKAIVDTQCKFSRITTYLTKYCVDSMLFLADKFKSTPPLQIEFAKYKGSQLNKLRLVNRLAKKYNDVSFFTDKICVIVYLIVETLLRRPNLPINFYITYGTRDSSYGKRCYYQENCGFVNTAGGTDYLADVLPQFPHSFVKKHELDDMPDTLSFDLPKCMITLTKKDKKIFIQKTTF